jgi:hypothetical protein
VGARHADPFPDSPEDPFPERIRAQAMPLTLVADR